MKKLFFIALFCCGLFAVSNAQVMTYTLNNASALDYKFKMVDAGPSGVIYHGMPAGTAPVSGIIAPFFSFNLDMKTKNSAGCYGSTSATGPGFGNIPLSGLFGAPCTVFSGVVYNITTTIPLVQYNMNLTFF